MQFDWPTPEQMMYRVTRLRRVIALAVSIPVGVMLMTALIDPSFLSPDRATLAALAVAVLIVGHVMLFPNVALETLSLSLSVTLLVVSVPWIKMLAWFAPVEYANAAYVILVGAAILVTGAAMVLFKALLSLLMYAGPAIQRRLTGEIDIACSTAVAHRQFTLQPATRRGRILSGAADSTGLFDVAIVAPQVADPQNPDQPFVARVTAKVMHSDAHSHQVMLVLGDGSVATSFHTFAATETGCHVTTAEMTGDFTLGMHAMFWLTDQQADNLTEIADRILSVPERANGLSHGVSFLDMAGALLSPREPVVNRAK